MFSGEVISVDMQGLQTLCMPLTPDKEAYLYIRLKIDATVHTVVTMHAFTCEMNGVVQIRVVHSRAGPTTAFGQVEG